MLIYALEIFGSRESYKLFRRNLIGNSFRVVMKLYLLRGNTEIGNALDRAHLVEHLL